MFHQVSWAQLEDPGCLESLDQLATKEKEAQQDRREQLAALDCREVQGLEELLEHLVTEEQLEQWVKLDSLDTLAYLEVLGFLVPQEIEVYKGLQESLGSLVLQEYQDSLDREVIWLIWHFYYIYINITSVLTYLLSSIIYTISNDKALAQRTKQLSLNDYPRFLYRDFLRRAFILHFRSEHTHLCANYSRLN